MYFFLFFGRDGRGCIISFSTIIEPGLRKGGGIVATGAEVVGGGG